MNFPRLSTRNARLSTQNTPRPRRHNQQQKAAQNLDADRLTARGVMGRMLDALDRDGFNAVGYSLGGLVKALDGSGDADVVDLLRPRRRAGGAYPLSIAPRTRTRSRSSGARTMPA